MLLLLACELREESTLRRGCIKTNTQDSVRHNKARAIAQVPSKVLRRMRMGCECEQKQLFYDYSLDLNNKSLQERVVIVLSHGWENERKDGKKFTPNSPHGI